MSVPEIRRSNVIPAWLVIGGLVLRLVQAQSRFLNPDEALHFLLSQEPSLAGRYQATLTTAHPPLFILVLHIWASLGGSELILRLLCVLAGLGFSWIMYRWVEKVFDQETALVSLSLLVFLPSLVLLSAELRQYSLLLFLAAAGLYFLDYAIEADSWRHMLCSTLALCFALLTHYSAFILALTLAVYALVRILKSKPSTATISLWVVGQLVTLTTCWVLFRTHVSRLKANGIPQGIADTWLHSSIFHPGQDRLLVFPVQRTINFFRYLFSHGTIGVFGILLFIFAVARLLMQRQPSPLRKPTGRQLAFLLALPFVITLAAAIGGLYPYGGIRHDALLAMFAIPGIGIGFMRLPLRSWRLKSAILAFALVVCNVFSSPTPPYIKFRDQNKARMNDALRFVAQVAPPRAIIFADHPAGLLLSYYLCGRRVVPLEALPEAFLKSDCGGYQIVTPVQRRWTFAADLLGTELQGTRQTYKLSDDTKIWLFQAGWTDNKDPNWRAALRRNGCGTPMAFGNNILVCDARVMFASARSSPARLNPVDRWLIQQ